MNRFSVKLIAFLTFFVATSLAFAQEKSYKIGETGPGGGIVFYKNASGFSVDDGNGNSVVCHYLEVSKEDLGCSTWGPDTDNFSTKYGIGEGKSATAEILSSKSKLSADNCAAVLCSKYKTATTKAGDWYLPTSDEIRVLFKNLTPEKLKINNTEFYWSSSMEKGGKAWARKNKTSTIESIDKKLMVRAIHAF